MAGVLGGGLAAVAVLGAVFVSEVASVRSDLEQSKAIIAGMASQVAAGRMDDVTQSSAQLSSLTESADRTVQGRLWHFASSVPVVGANVDAVRRVTSAVDILAHRAVPAGVELSRKLNVENVDVKSGGIDLSPFRDAEGQVGSLSDAFAAAKEQISPIDETKLLPAVAEPIQELMKTVNAAAPALEVVHRYLPTLLQLAGADGKKTYLVIFQNNAEIRATGGNPAASIVITVDNGKVEMMDQASSMTFGDATKTYTQLPADTLSLYPATFDQYSQDFTMTPDFPTTAELFQNLWFAAQGSRFDGVISVDPVVLAGLLKVAGPLTLATGEQLDSSNAVRVLLSESYERYPGGKESDAFFADVARRAFAKLTAGGWNPVEMLDALEESVQEQRVNLAFDDPSAAQLAAELGVQGALRSSNAERTQVGVYLNDYSVGKLEYHLHTSMNAVCDVSARRITVTMTMTNSIPDSIVSKYTLGERNARFGYGPRAMMLDVVYFAPPGASIVSTDPDAGDVPALSRSGAQKDNTGDSRMVVVDQGQTRTVGYTVQLPEGPLGPLELRHTPTASTTPVVVDGSCDALFAPR